MTLGQKQRQFALDVSILVQHIYASGYECTLGDAYRDSRVFGSMGEQMGYGRAKSAHKQRLAIDLNLFKDGQYLADTESHRSFGEYWKSIREGNVWGGDFDDGNHYSARHAGIA